MAEILLDTELSGRQRRCAEVVFSSGKALLSIINDILDFSKIEARLLELEKLRFNLESVIEDTAELFVETAYNKGIELHWRLGADLPAFVLGDPVRVRQVLSNLISNALKFTSQGEVVVSVRLLPDNGAKAKDETGNANLLFEVRDTGIGIESATLPKLFKGFCTGGTVQLPANTVVLDWGWQFPANWSI